ncbi:MAG: shikimate dehydrogenase [Kiritimatiellae bacterium]|nr:shikimate dehydrogenase [Kiritimatiellia bacterium]
MNTHLEDVQDRISGHTRVYAVLGHPIGHSLSPLMHNASFQKIGFDAVYVAFDVRPDRLLHVLPAMRDMGFGGVNLTVPLKEVGYRVVSALDESAATLGAVNTVEFLTDGTIKGHNTDGKGFLFAFEEAFHQGVRNLSVFILGTGGAGRAVAITCAMEGASPIRLADIEPQRAMAVAEEISRRCPRISVEALSNRVEDWTEACSRSDLVVHATPVGMKREDRSLLGPEAFRSGQLVYDLVYVFPETAFMRAARKAGALAVNGLGMLLHQGAYAFTIWTGRQADVAAMRAALETAVYGKQVERT